MPKDSEKRNGPPEDVLQALIEIHTNNGTLDNVLNSGISDELGGALMTQLALLAGRTDQYGAEPWSFDGDKLSLIADINAGTGSSQSGGFLNIDGDVYFSADDGVSGRQIWKIDGETGSVEAVTNIINTDNNLGIRFDFGGEIYFIKEFGFELHKMDIETGVVSHITDDNGSNVRFAGAAVEFNGDLYFSAVPDGGGGVYRYIIDGDTGVISRLDNTYSGGQLTEYNGALYFVGVDSENPNGSEIFKIDDSGAVISVADVDPLGNSFYNFQPIEFNGELYFVATDGVSGQELWKMGTDEVPVLVADINNGPVGSGIQVSTFTILNNELYFFANDGIDGAEVWKIDAAGTPSIVTDINPSDPFASVSPFGFHGFEGDLYLTLGDSGDRDLYKIDGETGAVDSFEFGSTIEVRILGTVNGSIAITAPVFDENGVFDRIGLFVSEGEPTSEADFTLVDDGSGTFTPLTHSLFLLEGDQFLF